jgi:Flp pilus assembly protein TadD
MANDRGTEALAVLHRARELDPTLYHPRGYLVHLHIRQSRVAEAVAEARTGVELAGRDPMRLVDLARALAADGRAAKAEEVFKQLTARAAQQHISPTILADAALAAGRREDAFQWLGRACDRRDPVLSTWLSKTMWPADFSSDPRFRELRSRMGLE